MPPDRTLTPNQARLDAATSGAGAVAIVGLDKNAGKTTVLNALVHLYRDGERPLVLTSIGYDGEAADLLHGHAKPQIYVFPGMSVITAADFLAQSTFDADIHTVFRTDTVFGPPVFAEARQAGFVTLAGPTSLHELVEMQATVLAELPTALFIIDGAFGRRMNASEAYADAVILCLSAGKANDADLVAELSHRQQLMTLPLAPDHVRHADWRPTAAEDGMTVAEAELDGHHCRFLRGAFTDRIALHWLAGGLNADDAIVIEDRANAFVSEPVLRRLRHAGVRLYAMKGAELKLIALNPVQAEHPERCRAAVEAAAAVPVIVLEPTPSIGKAL